MCVLRTKMAHVARDGFDLVMYLEKHWASGWRFMSTAIVPPGTEDGCKQRHARLVMCVWRPRWPDLRFLSPAVISCSFLLEFGLFRDAAFPTPNMSDNSVRLERPNKNNSESHFILIIEQKDAVSSNKSRSKISLSLPLMPAGIAERSHIRSMPRMWRTDGGDPRAGWRKSISLSLFRPVAQI